MPKACKRSCQQSVMIWYRMLRYFYLYRLGTWSNPDKTRLADFSRKVSVLRQEAISWDNGLSIFLFGYLDNGISVRVS
jgi:hypothetical protein